MAEIIDFATAEELIGLIEGANQAVSGMSAAEAYTALGMQEVGGMASFNVIQGGAGAAEVINIATGTAGEAFEAFDGAISAAGAASNANAYTANLTEIVTHPAAGTSAVATGGLLSLSLPTWFAAAAPVLGVAVGAGLYSLAPEFWEKVSRTLLPFAYPDTEVMPAVVDANGQVYFNKDAMDALKQLFQEEGVGDGHEYESSLNTSPVSQPIPTYHGGFTVLWGSQSDPRRTIFTAPDSVAWAIYKQTTGNSYILLAAAESNISLRLEHQAINKGAWYTYSAENFATNTTTGTYYGKSGYRGSAGFGTAQQAVPAIGVDFINGGVTINPSADSLNKTAWTMLFGTTDAYYPEGTSAWTGDFPPNPSPDIEVVTAPDTEITFTPVTLPTPDTAPGTSNDPLEYPNPVGPSINPAIEPHINPEVSPGEYPEELPTPDPGTRTAPLEDPVPTVDPTVNPDIDPSVDPSTEPELDPDPDVDPDVTPPSEGITPDPYFPPPIPGGFPDIVPTDSSGLIHVYNPTPADMIAFGRWLWVTYADASIDKIWNNPFDGIIGAHELYVTPTIGARENIRSGFLVSTASAPIVTMRYISINCGNIVIPEYYANYLDYTPYTKVHCYLPFIGIVELNADDIIGHAVNIVYTIDVYNGCCIAKITVARDGYSNTVYQFSGNCSVEVPLAGGSQAAIKAGLISAAAYGLTSVVGGIASGLSGNAVGAISGVGGGIAGAIAHAVSQKSSVQHSGSFGSSYGAMGIKVPYLIVRRPIQKIVYNYNTDYGFPAHKRIRIGDCKGYLRVREVNVISTSATDEEKKRIEELLKEGVYVD